MSKNLDQILILHKNEFPFGSNEFWHRTVDRLSTNFPDSSHNTILKFLVPEILNLLRKHTQYSISSNGDRNRAANTPETLDIVFDEIGFCVDFTLAALEFELPRLQSQN